VCGDGTVGGYCLRWSALSSERQEKGGRLLGSTRDIDIKLHSKQIPGRECGTGSRINTILHVHCSAGAGPIWSERRLRTRNGPASAGGPGVQVIQAWQQYLLPRQQAIHLSYLAMDPRPALLLSSCSRDATAASLS
jgi:hypothetical protein